MASLPELIQNLQEELICSICRDYFTNPMSIECGHSFCQSCLFRSWQEASMPFPCPECRSVSQAGEFKANVQLGKLADTAKRLRLHCLQYPGSHSKCETHQKVQKLFCEDDQILICVSCSESKEHKAHTLCCTDEAAEDFREKVKTEIKTISSEFKKAQQFLDEEKNEYLSVQRQGRANLKGLQERIRTLALQSQELRRRISESMEVCSKADVDLLQDIKGVLKRNESVIHKEVDILHINTIVRRILGILEMFLNFKMDITLDPDTADPGLIMSEDLKNMRYGGAQTEVPISTGRFSDFATVVGIQCLLSSRYYWAVEVPDNTGWCVGISNGSPGPEVFFVLVAIQSYSGCHLFPIGKHHISSVPHVKYCQHCVSNLMVGIFLDYEHGKVSFYNIKKDFLFSLSQSLLSQDSSSLSFVFLRKF